MKIQSHKDAVKLLHELGFDRIADDFYSNHDYNAHLVQVYKGCVIKIYPAEDVTEEILHAAA